MTVRPGISSIVDRVEGWGHRDASNPKLGDNGTWGSSEGNEIDVSDPNPETADARLARSLASRKSVDAEGVSTGDNVAKSTTDFDSDSSQRPSFTGFSELDGDEPEEPGGDEDDEPGEGEGGEE